MKNKLFSFLYILIALSLMVGFVGTQSARAITAHSALLYGDSLTVDSWSSTLAKQGTWHFTSLAHGGTAPCDWMPNLATDLATYQPEVVSLETVGNNVTPCMTGLAKDTPAYYARIQSDLDYFIRTVKSFGARPLLVAGPPMHRLSDPAWNNAVLGIINIEKQLSVQYGVKFTVAPRNAVSKYGKYVDFKPCLTSELTNSECVNGYIPVRTQPPAFDAGVHFCPTGLTANNPPCNVYDSGGFRFGRAVATAIKNT